MARALFAIYLCMLGVCGLILPANAAAAQTTQPEPVSLIADSVSFDPGTGVLRAAGNVQIAQGDRLLRTDLVIYDQTNGTITVPGALTLMSGSDLTTRAQNAVLDANLHNGLIQGAEILIAQQLQIVAQEFHRKDGRYKVLEKTVASSCYVCDKRQLPFWQIRSRRIIHDEQERRLYFEDATLELAGVPVLGIPRLRLPDPTVDRATGFLVPNYSYSNLVGYGISAPHYWVLNDHSDVTLTPEVFSDSSFLLGIEYRRRYANGSLYVLGTVAANDQLTRHTFRSSLTVDGRFDLQNDYKLSFGIDVASDKTMRTDYHVAHQGRDRLTSFIKLERTQADSYFNLSSTYIQSLRTNEVDQQIPLSLPEGYYRKTFDDPYFGGTLGLTAETVTLLRENDSRFLRLAFNIDWQKQWTFTSGLQVTATGRLDNRAYVLDSYPGFGNQQLNSTTPSAALDFRLPLARHNGGVTHVIEPRLQLVWSPDDLSSIPNEDSVQIEFEETNLFSLNRFPGFDAQEAGLRANLGVSYNRYDPNGWDLGVTVGQIFREADLGQFGSGSGLTGTSSDYVGAISASYRDRFHIVNRMVFDHDFDFSKHETQVFFNFNKITASAKYLWLDNNAATSGSPSQNEATVAATYRHDDNWSFRAAWRQDLQGDESSDSDFAIRYENECVDVKLSLSIQNLGSASVRANKQLGLTVELAGLGNKQRKERFRRRCRAY